MRRLFANAYFTVNALAASVAVVVGAIELKYKDLFSESYLASSFDYAEMLLLLPFIFVVIASKRIPKRTYLPLFLPYVVPVALFEVLPPYFDFLFRVVYLGLVAYCFNERRVLFGSKFGLVADEYLTKQSTSVARGFAALGILIATLFLQTLGYAIHAVPKLIEDRGYTDIQFKSDGIYTKVRTFQKGDQTAIVIGMFHVGDHSFYSELYSKIPLNAAVLLEGITDKHRKVEYSDSVEKAAQALKKQPQMSTFNPTLEVIRETINADVDVSELSDLAQEYAIREENEGSVLKSAFKSKEEKESTEKAYAQFQKERNEKLMRAFDENEPKFKTIVFAWGAGHSPYVTNALQNRGYKMTLEEEKKAFSYFDDQSEKVSEDKKRSGASN